MRALMLFGVAILALAASPARAQVPVTDVGHIAVSKLSWAKQALDMVNQLRQLQQQYMMLTRTYNAIAHATDVGGIASALGGVSRTYLPEASETLALVGQGSRLLSGAGGYRSADTLFLPQAQSGLRQTERWLTEMERRQNATANAKAIAESGLADMQQRMGQLSAAQARVSASRDGTETAAVAALISTSRANLDAHNASIANLRLALHAEDRAERQRAEQMEAQGAADWGADTQWAADSLGR